MKRRDAIALAIREKRVATEQVLLNRALRANKNRFDQLITRIVMTQIPKVEADVGRAKTLDAVAPRRERQ